MDIKNFINIIGADFYVGVPDSQLKPLCDYLMDTYGINRGHHIIAANEGNAVAIGVGYYLATGKIPVVYMQNSGEGNVINPITSLLNEKVYGIPCQFIIGWRGEPGVPDEPQHRFQGEITLRMLELLNITYSIVDISTTENDLKKIMISFSNYHKQGKQTALVVRKNALMYEKKINYQNSYQLKREEAIHQIISYASGDFIVATTGKTGRELYEIREESDGRHAKDFLCVGAMGHSSSIALGIAVKKPERRIWCLDGDGAILMHMGSMAVIGQHKPQNLVHIVFNNEAHESVGGMPTAVGTMKLCKVAQACGYRCTYSVRTMEELEKVLKIISGKDELCFIEVFCAISSRVNLGRPTIKPQKNKEIFMRQIKEESNG